MPNFKTKNVYFPSSRYRHCELSSQPAEGIVYVEFKSEVKAYDNIHYPRKFVDKIIDNIVQSENKERVERIFIGEEHVWPTGIHVKYLPKEEEPKRNPPEDDGLPF